MAKINQLLSTRVRPMNAEPWIWELDECLPSAHGAGREVHEQLLAQLEAANWSAADQFAVQMALEEALANAIKHGNARDESKGVKVSCRLANDHLSMRITDEGAGFAPDSVPDPCQRENRDRECGRGLKLMRSYMSEVRFEDDGRTVVMRKQRKL